MIAQTEWIEKFAYAVKPNAAPVAAPAPAAVPKSTKKNAAPAPPPTAKHSLQKALSESKSVSSDLTLSPDSTSSNTVATDWGPDWLLTAPEEILTLIAQRHFDETLQLITESEEYLAKDRTFYGAAEFVEKVGTDFGTGNYYNG